MKNQKYLFLSILIVFLGFSSCDDEEDDKIQLFSDFSASTTSAAIGESIQLTDESLGGAESWEWAFQGGTPSASTNQNPTVSFAEDGVYSICLVVQRGDDKDKTTKSGYITIGNGNADGGGTTQLFANFSVDNKEIIEGDNVQFTDESLANPNEWEWTFEGGNPATSTEQNPSVSYEKAGVYSVCLIAKSGQNQNKTTKSAYITVGYDLSNGLVAYYPFNGNANDQSGNANDGVVNGASLTTDRLGNVDAAYSFDGVNDFIEVAHSASLEFSNSFTLSTWVMASSFNTSTCESNRIFEKGDDGQVGSWGLYYDDNLESNGCGDFDPQKIRFKTGFAPSTGGRKAIAGNTNVALNHWFYLTSTYDGSRLIIYVNGHEEISIVADKALANNTASLFIGKQQSGSFPYFANATIDEIRIYNRALDQEEIRAVMNH